MKTLSVTIICKNEEDNLARLLPKLNFANQIVVVDTGSSDNSVAVAERYANVHFYGWRNDFAKARNFAISKAASEYVMWLDCDDDLPDSTIDGIKRYLADDDQRQDFVYLKYRMGYGSQFWFWRERIVRRCRDCRFKGFIHEAICPFGQTYYLDCDIVHTSVADHSQRNLAIYRDAIRHNRRFSLRDKFYYGKTLWENGFEDEAFAVLKKFATYPNAYIADRVAAYKLLSRICFRRGDRDSALKYLSSSLLFIPPDAETCCLFADVYFNACRYVYALRWYELALQSRVQVGFVNDYYKRLYPLIQLSVCYWRLGDVKTARQYHLLAKKCDPTNSVILNNDKWFNQS